MARPSVPKNGEANPVDAFLADRQKKEGLTWSPEAPKAILIRRLALDITGLPPTITTQPVSRTVAALDTLDEIRLVDGWHLDGVWERMGRHLTIYGGGKVNVNTVPEPSTAGSRDSLSRRADPGR